MRLLPRYSLRFLWLALTIFGVVLGVGVSFYRDYQAHELLVRILTNGGFSVAEEKSTLCGFCYAKKLTGLLGSDKKLDFELLEKVRDNPNIRQLSLSWDISDLQNQPDLNKVLAAVSQMPQLEVLELHDFRISEAHVKKISAIKTLHTLVLWQCRPEKLSLLPLNDHPRLEILRLELCYYSYEELPDRLPRLRALDLSHCKFPCNLPFTKAGLGRFPNLEYLRLDGADYWADIVYEAEALPKLAVLDLSGTYPEEHVTWDELPAAAPNLRAIGFIAETVDARRVEILRRLPKLRHLYLESWNHYGDFDPQETKLLWLARQEYYRYLALPKEQYAALLEHCPGVQMHAESDAFWRTVGSPGFDPSERWAWDTFNLRWR